MKNKYLPTSSPKGIYLKFAELFLITAFGSSAIPKIFPKEVNRYLRLSEKFPKEEVPISKIFPNEKAPQLHIWKTLNNQKKPLKEPLSFSSST